VRWLVDKVAVDVDTMEDGTTGFAGAELVWLSDEGVEWDEVVVMWKLVDDQIMADVVELLMVGADDRMGRDPGRPEPSNDRHIRRRTRRRTKMTDSLYPSLQGLTLTVERGCAVVSELTEANCAPETVRRALARLGAPLGPLDRLEAGFLCDIIEQVRPVTGEDCRVIEVAAKIP